MTDVTIRDLRNRGGEIVDRVAGGEPVTVTRDGKPVAELRPLPRTPLNAAALQERMRLAPAVDPQRLRDDVDSLLDTSL